MKLREFQRADVEAIKRSGLRALLANSPGTGKTITSIRALVETPGSMPALVVCPASVTRNWAREFKRWAPYVKIRLIDDMSTPVRPPNGQTVYITSWSLLDVRCDDILRLEVETIIGDECHAAKGEDALRSQAFSALTRAASGVLLLSGTPILNTQQELQTLYSYLRVENPLMIRRLLEDVAPDIPPKRRSTVRIRMRPEHQEVYDRATEDFETWLRQERAALLGDGLTEADVERSLAAEAFTKIGYLRRLVGIAKVHAAADWICRAVRIGEPVVVFLEHQNVLRKLSRLLRKARVRHGVLEGSTPARKRQEIVDSFQAHKFPVFIGTRAAKEGITLTAARHLLFVERFYTSAEEEQAEDRIRRIGQEHPTTMWYLHAVDTIDDRLEEIVRTKRRIIRTAIGSAETAESPISNVEAMLRSWDKHTLPSDQPVQPLGLGSPLPPLPNPNMTHAVVFHGERWNPRSGLRWCKMNGYDPKQRVDLVGRFRLVIHPAGAFKTNAFDIFHVSKDIKLITGKRVRRGRV